MLQRILLVLFVSAGICSAATHEVGPGKPFGRIEDAVAQAAAGDTIVVTPTDQPYSKTAVLVTKPRLTIKSADPGKQVKLSGDNFAYSGRGSIPRAIIQFNPGADGCTLEGFDLFGAHNDTHNAAGVRINAANDITIRNCTIHDNDMGIMSNGKVTQQTGARQFIDRCHIHSNGAAKDPGYNHNLYLGGTSVLVRGCDIHSPTTGHNVKSRAHLTWVEYSYIHDSPNREFDLVDDLSNTSADNSHAVLLGNIIVKRSDMTGNKTVIHFGQDQGHDHTGNIHLIHNTILTPYQSPVVDLSAKSVGAVLINNLIYDPTGNTHHTLISTRNGASLDKVAGQSNAMSPGFTPMGQIKPYDTPLTPGQMKFVDPAHADYRLTSALSPVQQQAPWQSPPRPLGQFKTLERYQHPCNVAPLQVPSVGIGAATALHP